MIALALLAFAQVEGVPADGLELRLEAVRLRLAHDAPVAEWADSSSRGRTFTQAEAEFRPRLRTDLPAPVVRFDGRDDRLGASGLDLSFREATIFLVAAPHSSPGDFRAFFSAAAAGGKDFTSGINIDLGHAERADFGFINVEGAGFGGERNLMAAAAPLGTFHTICVTSRPGARGAILHVDGLEHGARDRKPSMLQFSDLRLGSRRYTHAADPPHDRDFFEGDIAEFLVYGRALGEDERKSIEGHLHGKYAGLLKMQIRLPDPPPSIRMAAPGFTVRELPVRLTNLDNLEYAPDGRLFALGYDGRLNVLRDTDGDGLEETAKPYWVKGEGDLRGPIGMVLAPEGIYVASKGKISLVKDTDGDGEADLCETVTTGWKEIPQNVDAVGMALDEEGNLYFGLGCANYANAYLVDKEGRGHYDVKSERGTILKIPPDRKSREIVCTGVRFTVSLQFNRHGDLFATDQEGATWLPDGNPLDELLHILPGRHYGFPPRHAQHNPSVIDEPAVALFGPQHQSTCGFRFNEPAPGRKPFGPAAWEGDALVTGESRGKIWRVPLVKTPAGYVATPVLIASLRMLTVDLCLSPAGDLLVACHSGKPDWGTGPKGIGRIFKISFSDRAAPQPVTVWPAGPLEVRVAFDRPVDPASLRPAAITMGEFASAGDRHEVLVPPYKVVEEQRRSARHPLRVERIDLSEDRRTAILTTAPHPWEASYALSLGEMDLGYDMSGVAATWTAEGAKGPAWSGWLPHPDLDVARAFTAGSAEHERLYALLEKRGTLALRANLLLPGKRAWLKVNGKSIEAPHEGKPFAFAYDLGTAARRPELRITFHSDIDPRDRPLAPGQLRLPWAPVARPPRPAPAPVAAAGPKGDPVRGRALFFGEAKCGACHAVRGEGGAFAPDLSNLAHRDAAGIRRDIVEPTVAINPDYPAYVARLRDGRVLSGVLFAEEGGRLRIVDTNAAATTVSRAEIEELRASSLSIMPEGYAKLGEEKLADLIAFLTAEPGR